MYGLVTCPVLGTPKLHYINCLGINYWKWNVIIYIHNRFGINYVIIFCQMVFEGPDEVYGVNFRSLAALNKAAVTSLNKDKVVRAHKVITHMFLDCLNELCFTWHHPTPPKRRGTTVALEVPVQNSVRNAILFKIITCMKLLFSNYLGGYNYSFRGSSKLISITVTVSLFSAECSYRTKFPSGVFRNCLHLQLHDLIVFELWG